MLFGFSSNCSKCCLDFQTVIVVESPVLLARYSSINRRFLFSVSVQTVSAAKS